MPEVISKELLTIDYPETDERITHPHYTIRVGVFADANRVEVSIDDSEWQPCRHAVGYWWYDWSRYQSGQHEVIARVHLRDGHTFTTAPRPFRVELKAEKETRAPLSKTDASLRGHELAGNHKRR